MPASPLSSKKQPKAASQLLSSIAESHFRQENIVEIKNQDYSRGENEYHNFELVNKVMPWISPEEGIIVRMMDKLARVAMLAHYQENYVTDESLIDTLDDIANYANILIAYFEYIHRAKAQDRDQI